MSMCQAQKIELSCKLIKEEIRLFLTRLIVIAFWNILI